MNVKEYIRCQFIKRVNIMINKNPPDSWSTEGMIMRKWQDSSMIVPDADYSLESEMIRKAKESGMTLKEPLLKRNDIKSDEIL